ncbi:uncharacterized protein K452DRAFT_317709 [Aplosporella prunicola CBS 121167]|uniref:Store-operated calcium entry-associated regulatory factor n=1 Tax=Aplosporella prunicola CBS 121167 TaxID=1176127 RepID=A0A6A6BF52_9PEZI|nr:uncharacterized protein K452DRAFT_317709 [Aplosporella prunicola CBS 121167]KAF2142790.1 hypothetical protein K452DRAFT_317709 [Aplosporella prunicola CBS 121167]
MRLSTSLCPALLATLAVAAPASRPSNSILLSNVKTLTLRHGLKTSARRVSPIPQLTCIGGDASGLYTVDVMRCKNAGADYDPEDIQWTCTASLPPEFKLGSTDVICEGYDGPDDPYILKGSCGVEYRLSLTEKGIEKYGHRRGHHNGSEGDDPVSPAVAAVFWLLFVAVLLYMLFKACIVGGGRARDPTTWTGPRGGGPGGGGGGGGGGGPYTDSPDDPPPPYMPTDDDDNNAAKPPGYGTDAGGRWKPGFWSGAGAGGAAGYAAGRAHGAWNNRNNNNGSSFAGPSNSRGGSWGSSSSGGSGGFGGGGGSSPAPSSSRYEGTGFGGTKRR